MKNPNLNNVTANTVLTVIRSVYNPYSGDIVAVKGEAVRVKEVLRYADEITRLTIFTGAESHYSKFAIVSKNHLDFSDAFALRSAYHYPKADSNDLIKMIGDIHNGIPKIPASLAHPAGNGDGVSLYQTSNGGKVGVFSSNGYHRVMLKPSHVYNTASFREIGQLLVFCADTNSMP